MKLGHNLLLFRSIAEEYLYTHTHSPTSPIILPTNTDDKLLARMLHTASTTTCNTTRARPHPHTPSITTDDPPLCHHPGDKQLMFRTDAQLVRLRNATRRRLRKTVYTSTWSIELADYLQDQRRYAVACTVWATRNLETRQGVVWICLWPDLRASESLDLGIGTTYFCMSVRSHQLSIRNISLAAL